MALDLDGFAVLRAVGSHAVLFADVRADAAKAARALIVKQLKNKTTTLQSARALRRALGDETFALVVDGLKDAEAKSLTTKLDKHHPELKTANPTWRRRHLLALAAGDVEPSAKAVKAKKVAGSKGAGTKRASEPEFLSDDSAGAVRKR